MSEFVCFHSNFVAVAFVVAIAFAVAVAVAFAVAAVSQLVLNFLEILCLK